MILILMHKYFPLLSFILLTASLSLQTVSAQTDQWQDVERIVAVGDIHGDYDGYIEVLRNADLINRRGNWNAGETHFVQLGDLPDRGPDTDEIIEHLKKLEKQAEEAGGMVHPLIGNHEAMNIYGDLRYVLPEEYKALRSRQARRYQDRYYEQVLEQLKSVNPLAEFDSEHRRKFNEDYPLGFVEHRIAWAVDGDIGSWVAGHNSVIKINRTLFMHGGISPEVVGTELTQINQQIRDELAGARGEELGLSEAQTGPLWYRGLASNDEMLEQPHLESVLQFYDVDRVVIAHTPGMGTIVPRFGARVLLTDTGISAYYGSHLASLLIEGNELTTIQAGEAIPIPAGEDSLLPYYESVAAQGNITDALRRSIEALRAESSTAN